MRYFYYRIYQLLKKVKTNDTPAFNALLLLGLLQTINIATILALIKFFTEVELEKQQVVVGGIAVSFLLLIIEFKTLFHKKDEIYRHYENETKEERRRGTVYLLVYILLTIIIFFVVVETLIN